MDWSAFVAHWLHLTAAILWVGGTLAVSLVVHPVLRAAVPEGQRLDVYRQVGARFARLQWACWAVLGATGGWKLWELRTAPAVFRGAFGRVLAVKLVLVAAMVALSLIHSQIWGPAILAAGTPAERAALGRRAAVWGKVNGGLMLAIVFCAVMLRYRPW